MVGALQRPWPSRGHPHRHHYRTRSHLLRLVQAVDASRPNYVVEARARRAKVWNAARHADARAHEHHNASGARDESGCQRQQGLPVRIGQWVSCDGEVRDGQPVRPGALSHAAQLGKAERLARCVDARQVGVDQVPPRTLGIQRGGKAELGGGRLRPTGSGTASSEGKMPIGGRVAPANSHLRVLGMVRPWPLDCRARDAARLQIGNWQRGACRAWLRL